MKFSLQRRPNPLLELLPEGAGEREHWEPLDNPVYFIFITPRTGSTFLTSLLRETGQLGTPDEWFNPSSIGVGKRIRRWQTASVPAYVHRLVENVASPNGCFGAQLAWPHYRFLRQIMDPQSLFSRPVQYFYLRRKNIILQAISWYKARVTRVFHSYQKRDETVSAARYDGEAIARLIEQIIRQEKRIENFFARRGIAPVRLYYEDVVGSPAEAIRCFSSRLGYRVDTDAVQPETGISKLGNAENHEWEARFLRERPLWRLRFRGYPLARALPAPLRRR